MILLEHAIILIGIQIVCQFQIDFTIRATLLLRVTILQILAMATVSLSLPPPPICCNVVGMLDTRYPPNRMLPLNRMLPSNLSNPPFH